MENIERTADSRGATGEACRSCETPFDRCTAGIYKSGGKACCGTCAYTDTHKAREPIPPPPLPLTAMQTVQRSLAAACGSFDANAVRLRREIAEHVTKGGPPEGLDELAGELWFILRDRRVVEQLITEAAEKARQLAALYEPPL